MNNKKMLIDGVKFELGEDYVSLNLVSSFAGTFNENSEKLLPSFHLTYADMEYEDSEVVYVISSNLVKDIFKAVKNFDKVVEKSEFSKTEVEIQAYDFIFEDVYSDALNEKLPESTSISARIAEDVNMIIPFSLNITLTKSDLKNITDLFDYVSDNVKISFEGSKFEIFTENKSIKESLDLCNPIHKNWVNNAINSESSEVFAYAIYLLTKNYNKLKTK